MQSIDSNENKSGRGAGKHSSNAALVSAPQSTSSASMGGTQKAAETTLVDQAIRFADWGTGFFSCAPVPPPMPPAIVAESLEATGFDEIKEKALAFASHDGNAKPAAAVVEGRVELIDDDEGTPAIPRRSVDVWGKTMMVPLCLAFMKPLGLTKS